MQDSSGSDLPSAPRLSEAPSPRRTYGRRHFMGGFATGLARVTTATILASSALPWPQPWHSAGNAQARGSGRPITSGPNFFTAEEFAMVRQLCERIYPQDEEGPGADGLGVPLFIDGQLSTPYGYGARWYMHGPFVAGPPEAGYQLPYAPRQLYRLALERLNAFCLENWQKPFVQLSEEVQVDLLTWLEKDALSLGPVPGNVFFELLRANTLEGVFSDPIHGGNHLMKSWYLTGFPGARADFMDWINQEGAAYPFGPVSIPVLPHKRDEQG
ncbi:gluconate 2-dehydrogenase subunit 3 family protein [Oecophyllibacter saccharovorans]|nr:gluconate 2-dehydrogenase subunit 3 family protein [Oecophyllibacter saccharovorans]